MSSALRADRLVEEREDCIERSRLNDRLEMATRDRPCTGNGGNLLSGKAPLAGKDGVAVARR